MDTLSPLMVCFLALTAVMSLIGFITAKTDEQTTYDAFLVAFWFAAFTSLLFWVGVWLAVILNVIWDWI